MTVPSRERAKVHKMISLQCSKMNSACTSTEKRVWKHSFGATRCLSTICERALLQGGGM